MVSGQWSEKPAPCASLVCCYNGGMEMKPRPRLRWLRLTPDRAVPGLLILEGFLLLAGWFGWFTFDRHKGYAMLITIAAVGAALVLMLLWFLVAPVFRRRFQFSLRSLMLLVVVVAIPCSWFATAMKAAREQRAAVEAIEKLGGWVNYDYEYDETDPFAPDPPMPGTAHQLPGPAWLCRRLGVDLLANVVVATVSDSQFEIGEAWLDSIKCLSHLQLLILSGAKVNDAGLEQIKGLTELKYLELRNTKISDAGLQHLKGLIKLQSLHLGDNRVSGPGLEHLKGLPRLQSLDLSLTEISDPGLEHLKGLSQLQWLHLGDTGVSGPGLVHLKGLTQLQSLVMEGTKIDDDGLEYLKGLIELKSLDLSHTNVSNAGLEYLKGLTQLESLDLSYTNVSGAGVRKLQKALPQAVIKRRGAMRSSQH